VFGDVAFAQAPFAAQGGATLFSSIAETATGSDSSNQIFQAGALIQELATATSAAASLNNILVVARAETATATDVTNFAASNFVADYYEGVSALDTSSTAGSNYLAAVAESATATDAASAIAALYAAVAEAATGTDEVNGSRLYVVAITETATGTSAQSTSVIFPVSVAEAATAIDAYAKLKTLNVYPQGLQLNVYVGNVLVWGTIPTDQTPPDPNWQNIPT
jgi:hypothetical protein